MSPKRNTPVCTLKNKLAIHEGTWNGVHYPEDELKILLRRYQAIEAIPHAKRTIEQRHALDLFKGNAEDHQDSTGTWVGDVSGAYWDESKKGICFKNVNIVDADFAEKIEYQKQRGSSSFGISPRLMVLRKGNTATDIIPKNLGIVLDPAGMMPVMLNKEEEKKYPEHEGTECVFELTLSDSDSNTLNEGKEQTMDGEEKKMTLTEFKALQQEADKENQVASLGTQMKNIEEKLEQVIENAEKMNEKLEGDYKQPEEDKLKEQEQKEIQKDKDKEKEEKGMQEEKPEEEKKEEPEEDAMQADKPKAKYYGNLSGQSVLQKLSISPDLSLLDAISINRVAEDLVKSMKKLDKEFTLEEAKEAVGEIHNILNNIPKNKKEQEAVLKSMETTLSREDTKNIENKDTKTLPRKGLVLHESAKKEDRSEESLSKKEPLTIETASVDDIQDLLEDALARHIGVE